MKLNDLINNIKNSVDQQQRGSTSYFARQSPILANILSEFKNITSFLSASNKQLESISKSNASAGRVRSVSKPSFTRRAVSAIRRMVAPLTQRSRRAQPLRAQKSQTFVPRPQQTVSPSFAPPFSFQQPVEQQFVQEQQPAPQQPIGVDSVLRAAAIIAAANAIKQTDFKLLVDTILKRIGITSELTDEIEDEALKIRERLKEGTEDIDEKTPSRGKATVAPGMIEVPKTDTTPPKLAEAPKIETIKPKQVTKQPSPEPQKTEPAKPAETPEVKTVKPEPIQPPKTETTQPKLTEAPKIETTKPTETPEIKTVKPELIEAPKTDAAQPRLTETPKIETIKPKQPAKQPAPVQEQKRPQAQPISRPPAVEKPSISPAAPASSITVDFIKKKESFVGKAIWDYEGYSVGYGHLIKPNEVKQGFIDLGGGERVRVSGEGGKDTTITKEQADKLFAKDLKVYEDITAKGLGEAWNKLNDSQKAALVSYTYNTGPGGFKGLLDRGLKEAILANDTEKAAKLIETGIRTAGKKVLPGLVARRKEEADLFREKSESTGKKKVSSLEDQQPTQLASNEQSSSLEPPEYRGPSLNDRSGQVAFKQQVNEEPPPIINLVDNSVYTTERKKTAPQIDSPSAIYPSLT